MASTEIRATLKLIATEFISGIRNASTQLNNFTRSVNNMGRNASSAGKTATNAFQDMGKSITNIGSQISRAGYAMQRAFAPLAGMAKESADAYINYESGLADVSKTTGITGDQLTALGKRFRELSKEVPTSSKELLNLAYVAGQLGINGSDDLYEFTRVVAMMGDTTNLSGETGAKTMARFLNIMGESPMTVEKLGSSLVWLGNNTATSEAEIAAMGLRIAAAGKQVGLTSADVMGFAATLSSLGIRAEMGGSAFSKLMVKMQVASETGGKSLDNFAKVSGMTADQFKTAFQKDAKGAIVAFLKGLKDTERNGKSAISVLDEMGITEVRLRDTILRAAEGVDMMDKNLQGSNQAYQEGNALAKEAAVRYGTLKSKIAMLKNTFHDIGIEIGGAMAPYMEIAIDLAKKLAEKIGGVNPKILGLIGVIGVLGVALGGVMVILGSAIQGFGGFVTMLEMVGKGITTLLNPVAMVSKTFGLLGKAFGAILSPMGLVVIAIGAVVASLVYCWNNVEGFKENCISAFQTLWQGVKDIFGAIAEVISGIWGGIKDTVIPVVEGLARDIGNAFNSIVETVGTVMSWVADFLVAAWEVLSPLILPIVNGLVKGVGQVLSGLIKGVGYIMQAVNYFFKGEWDKAAQLAFKGGVSIVKGLWDGLVSVITGVTEGICTIIDEMFTPLDENSQLVVRANETVAESYNSLTKQIAGYLSGNKELIEEGKKDWEDYVNSTEERTWKLTGVFNDTFQSIVESCSLSKEASTQVQTAFSDMLNNVIFYNGGTKGEVMSTWTAIKQAIADNAGQITPEVAGKMDELVQKIKDTDATAYDDINDKWSALKATINRHAKEAAENGGAEYSKIGDKVKEVNDSLQQTLDADYAAATETTTQGGQNMAEGAANAYSTLPQEFGLTDEQLQALISGDYDAFAQTTSEGMANAQQGAADAYGELPNNVGLTDEQIQAMMSGDFSMFTDTATEGMANAQQSAADAWNQTPNNVSNTNQQILNGTQTDFNAMANTVGPLMDQASQSASNAWDKTDDNISQTNASIQQNMEQAMSNISSKASEMANKVTNAWNTLSTAISTASNKIGSTITTSWNKISNTMTVSMNRIKQITTTGFTQMITAITSAMNRMASQLTNSLTHITNAFKNGWTNMVNTVTNLTNQLVSRVVSALNQLPARGAAAVNSLRASMSSAFEGCVSQAYSAASRIKGAFENMHIRVPRPVLPHISVSTSSYAVGNGGSVSVPNFSVNWYAKGGFFNGASVIGVGEQGREAVLPLENKRNMQPFADAVASRLNDTGGAMGDINITYNIQATIREESDIRKLSTQLEDFQRRELKRRGR